MAWTSEAQRECHKELVDKVVKDMEQGKVFFWDKANYGHPPRNVKPRTDKGHEGEDARYHGKNIMLLTIAVMDKGYTDSRWGTYEAIKEMGGQVRKGELSTKIECWIWSKPKRAKDSKGRWHTVYEKDAQGQYRLDRNGKKIPKMVRLEAPIVKTYCVFNAQQAEGLPPEHVITIDEKDRSEKMETILKNSEAAISYDQCHENYYSKSEDEIHLMKREDFKTMDDFYATAVHEIAHSTGAENRLNRESLTKGEGFGSPTYAKEELCAEMASMFLAQEYGVKFDEDHYKNHAAYLHSWVEALKKDPDELYRAAEQAEKAVEYIKSKMLHKKLELEQTVEQKKTPVKEAKISARMTPKARLHKKLEDMDQKMVKHR